MKITTAGESHGKGLFAIMEGIPAGLTLNIGAMNAALALRQSGYGRGERQQIERDEAEILSGVRGLVTTGSPITLAVWNRDYENWKDTLAPEGCDERLRPLTTPRPGHADLVGAIKYGQTDARNVSERASARETAIRVAAGEVCRRLLEELGVEILSYTRSVGPVSDPREYAFGMLAARDGELHMLDNVLTERAKGEIDRCRAAGDTLGGVCEIRVKGLKSGFGSCMTSDKKLDARLSAAVMGLQAAKGVEWGAGFAGAALPGSAFHDAIFCEEGRGYYRKTNRAGGVEGGMSNGEELILRVAMKPLPTLKSGLSSVDLSTGQPARAAAERGDVCAILAFGVVAEAAVCAELAAIAIEWLGGDTLAQMKKRYGELPQ